MKAERPLSKEIVIEIPPSEPFFPPFVDGRDKEFRGHGPFITVMVILQKIGNRQIGYQIFMDAIETHDDFTFFQGHTDIQIAFTIDQEYPDYFIATILSDTASGVRLIDTDTHPNNVKPNYGNLVREFIIEGDQKGEDAPWVQIEFNKVHLKIVESPHAFLRRIQK